MWTLISGFTAILGAWLVGSTAGEMFMIALLAMCYSELCDINRKVGRE